MVKSSNLQILAPCNSREEVEPLISAGADCLYGGCLPTAWQERFPGTVLLNQRTFASAQFSSLKELSDAVSAAREAGKGFALTLNAPFYMDDQLPMVMELVKAARQMGVSGLIVADPGLIRSLALEEAGTPVHLSTMGLAANSASVGFYRSLGVTRIILPRMLSVSHIREIITHHPEMEYEAFLLVGKCPNVEGVCSFVHDDPERRWPCEWQYDTDDDEGGSALRHYLDRVAGTDRRQACGLCALPLLAAAGVSTIKIVGRGAPLAMKLKYARALSWAIREMPDEPDIAWQEECRRQYADIYGRSCTINNCYFPEVILP
jgi:putative protease